MKRWIYFGGVLFFASVAHGATARWLDKIGDGECGALMSGHSCYLQFTTGDSADAAFVDYVETNGRFFVLRIEPQIAGTNTAAQADVFCCQEASANACTTLLWDTDADGVVDDNTLDATNAMKIATPVFLGCPYVTIDPIADPASGTAEVGITGEATK